MTISIKTAHGWLPWLAAIPVCGNSNDLQGVFRPATIEQAQAETGMHATHYARCIEKYLNGAYPGTGNERWIAMKRDMSRFKLTGAYGEQL